VLQCQVEPVRLVVTLFDDNSMFQSSTMYPRGDRTGIGFYLQGPEGTFYTQDTRNPGASPQALFYRGSGENAGQLWLAFEDCAPQRGSDRDFDDVVLFIENRPSDVLPVEATTWGRLKARFR
jgi:hypothetical protein